MSELNKIQQDQHLIDLELNQQDEGSDSLKKAASKRKKIKKMERNQSQSVSNLQSNKITNYFTKRKAGQNQERNQLFVSASSNKRCKDTEQVFELQNTYEKLLIKQKEVKQQWELQKKKYDEKLRQFEAYKRKSMLVVGDSIKDLYQNKRKEKAKIDYSLGYYRSNMKQFVEGTRRGQLNKLKTSILQSLQSQNLPEYSRIFLNQQLQQISVKQMHLKQQMQEYKINLKLSLQQKNSKFCLQNWPCLFRRYQTLQLLGKGGFSQVYKSYDLLSDQFMAVKLSSAQGINLNNVQNYMRYVNRECQIHKNLDHPNIARVKQTIELGNQTVATVMEYCQGPQLFKYMKDHKFLPQNQAKNIIRQLFSVLVYLGNQNPKIIHYDLKPQNIMFHKGKIKVLDFGLSKIIEQGRTDTEITTKGIGTYWYLPPEAFKQSETISSKLDVWSLGVIFYQMVFGQKPFGNNMNQTEIFNKGAIVSASEVKFPKNCSLSFQGRQFIKKCLKYNQQKRYTPEEAFNSKYLTF